MGAESDTQLEHERTVIAVAKEEGVRHIVKLSSTAADVRSPMKYARASGEEEQILKDSGVAYTILRATAFMHNFFESVVHDSIYTCAEDGTVAMVDTRDIAAVAAVVLTSAGHEDKTYRVTGPVAVSYDEAAKTLSAATGRNISHVRVQPTDVTKGLTSAGLPLWMAEDLAIQFSIFAAGRGERPCGDVAAVTGRIPRSLDEFAREEFATRAVTSGAEERAESAELQPQPTH